MNAKREFKPYLLSQVFSVPSDKAFQSLVQLALFYWSSDKQIVKIRKAWPNVAVRGGRKNRPISTLREIYTHSTVPLALPEMKLREGLARECHSVTPTRVKCHDDLWIIGTVTTASQWSNVCGVAEELHSTTHFQQNSKMIGTSILTASSLCKLIYRPEERWIH